MQNEKLETPASPTPEVERQLAECREELARTNGLLRRAIEDRDAAVRELKRTRDRIYHVDRMLHEPEMWSMTVDLRYLHTLASADVGRQLEEILADSMVQMLRRMSGEDFLLQLLRKQGKETNGSH